MGPRAKFLLAIVVAFVCFSISSEQASADTYTKLLLHGDGVNGTYNFLDSSGSPHEITRYGNAHHSTDNPKFPLASIEYTYGTGDRLKLASSQDFVLEGDFTVDFWVKWKTNTACIFINTSSNNTFEYAPDGIIYFVPGTVVFTWNWSPNIGQWHHFALVKKLGTVSMYIDGSLRTTASHTGIVNWSAGPDIGRYNPSLGGTDFNGFLDEFRVSNVARWEANFTPPTAPYDSLPAVTLIATPPTIDLKNGPTQASLSWTSSNASSVTIEPGIGPVDLTGSTAVSPEGSTEYTITATGEYGSSEATAVVTVLNGYSSMGDFTIKGKLGIGTLNPQSALAVNGIVSAKEVKVSSSGWSDYVFDEEYKLPPLKEVEDFVRSNKHLPGIPPEKEIEQNGLTVSEMFSLQMRKIEELVLYVIELTKRSDRLQQENDGLRRRLEIIAPEK